MEGKRKTKEYSQKLDDDDVKRRIERKKIYLPREKKKIVSVRENCAENSGSSVEEFNILQNPFLPSTSSVVEFNWWPLTNSILISLPLWTHQKKRLLTFIAVVCGRGSRNCKISSKRELWNLSEIDSHSSRLDSFIPHSLDHIYLVSIYPWGKRTKQTKTERRKTISIFQIINNNITSQLADLDQCGRID